MNRTRLTQRDRLVLADMFGHAVLVSDHLVALGHFGSLVRARTRLRRLITIGLVRRVEVGPWSGPRLLFAASATASAIVAEELNLEQSEVTELCRKRYSMFQINHLFKITEFRVAIEHSCKARNLEVRWQHEVQCHHSYSIRRGGRWARSVVKPDGLVQIRTASREQHFFVEIDLGHVSQKRFSQKIASYRQYAQGVFQETYGDETFKVLVVTTGRRRLQHLNSLVKSENPLFLFSTFEQLCANDPLGPIWTIPGLPGYHDIVEGRVRS